MSDTKEYKVSPLELEIMVLERARYDIAKQHIRMIQEGTLYAQEVCFKEYVRVCDLLKELYKKSTKVR